MPALSRRSLLGGLVGSLGVTIVPSPASGSAPPPEWTREFDSDGIDSVTGVVTDGRGITVVGYSVDTDGWVRRYDYDGGLEWTRTTLAGRPKSLVRTPDAGFLVASSAGTGVRVTRLEPDGTVDRRTDHDLSGRPTALAVRADGGHGVTAVNRAPDRTLLHVAAGDPQGAELWQRELTTRGSATSLLAAEEGGLLVPIDLPERSAELRRLDATGSEVAVSRHDLPGVVGPTAIRTDDDGLLLAGVETNTFDPGPERFPWVVKLDATLDEQWRRRYESVTRMDGPRLDGGFRAASTPSGYLLAGTEEDRDGRGTDLAPKLVRLGDDGSLQSVERYPREASHRLLAASVIDDHRTVIAGPTTTDDDAHFRSETTDAVLAVVDDRTETTETPPPTTWADTPTPDPTVTETPTPPSDQPTPAGSDTTATTTPGFGVLSALGAAGLAGAVGVLSRSSDGGE